jgi:hypothetical protein
MSNIVNTVRFDYVPSYWIFLWFLLYYFKIVKANPKLLLQVGLIENCILFALIVYYQNPLYTILGFIVVNTFIKILPIYLLRNTHIGMNDIIWYLIVLGFYFIWLYINNVDIVKMIHQNYELIRNKKYDPPLLHSIRKLFNINI